jgi:hypothetical protein
MEAVIELNKKLEKASILLNILLKKRSIENPEPCNRYYTVLKMYNTIRNEITNLKNKALKQNKNSNNDMSFEEKRAVKEANVTSTTYERARNNTNKSIDNLFKRR